MKRIKQGNTSSLTELRINLKKHSERKLEEMFYLYIVYPESTP